MAKKKWAVPIDQEYFDNLMGIARRAVAAGQGYAPDLQVGCGTNVEVGVVSGGNTEGIEISHLRSLASAPEEFKQLIELVNQKLPESVQVW